MSFVERIMDLQHRRMVIESELDDLHHDLINFDEWSVCFHVHYAEPRVSVWKQGDDTGSSACFIIKEGCAEIHTIGMYQNNWQEAEAFLNELLTQDFSEDIKVGGAK